MKKPFTPDTFSDTEVAFRYKSNLSVKKAYFIFLVVNHPWVSSVATGAVRLALRLRLPVESLIRNTVFELFCGGETIEKTHKAVGQLGKYHVKTILDYSVEGEATEQGFDHVRDETIRTIEKAASSIYIPFSVFKVTGLASADLLEKVHNREKLTDADRLSFDRVRTRVDAICKKAHDHKIPVLIDAEETWIQDAIDDLAYEMMMRYNQKKPIVFNTYQLYRTEGLNNLTTAYSDAIEKGFFLGAKIVRGAYMEKERARAEKMGYPSPIHPDKASTDEAFNQALSFAFQHRDRISVMCGSHNEYSNYYLASMMEDAAVTPSDERIWFAQLYGMSDNISFGLANNGYNVAKYLPYGPVRSVMPYLLRRAAENTSVAGQSSRELVLITREMERRKKTSR